MNKSIEFTRTFVAFCSDMIARGRVFKIAEVRRGEMQQYFYYLSGRSRCNGITNRSNHQDPTRAADLDFYDENGRYFYPDNSPDVYLDEHHIWQSNYGGKPVISWDLRHFEI